MSIRAVSWALDFAPLELSAVERFVLVALADHVDDETRKAWPSVGRLSQRTGLSRRSVQGALRRLEDVGIITCLHQQAPKTGRADLRPNLYHWHPERSHGTHLDGTQPVDNHPTGAQEMHPERGAGDARGAGDDRTGRTRCAQTVNEPSDTRVDVGEELTPVHNPPSVDSGDPFLDDAAEAWWQNVYAASHAPLEQPPALHVHDRAAEARAALRAGQDSEEHHPTKENA